MCSYTAFRWFRRLSSSSLAKLFWDPPEPAGHAHAHVELDLERGQRAFGQGVVVALDHGDAVRDILTNTAPYTAVRTAHTFFLGERTVFSLQLAVPSSLSQEGVGF